MPALRPFHEDDYEPTLRFPIEQVRQQSGQPSVIDDALEALSAVNRRIDHLARELNCPSHFDDGDDDRPRAA